MLGLATFRDMLRGRSLVLYSDNCGAEHSTSRGSARSADHNHIVHEVWSMVLRDGLFFWLERVASEDNISDSPSRGDHALLADIGAQWHRPCWDL